MRRAFRLMISAAFALVASAGLASAKDSVTIGMVLEPPGLDPTTGAAAAKRSKENFTSFALNGSPSWNFTFGLRVKV